MKPMNDQPPLLPLTHLALEVDTTADRLAAELAAQVVADDIGRLCVPKDTARHAIAAHNANQAAAAEAKQQQQEALSAVVAAESEPLHRRIKATASRDRALRDDGRGDLSALEKMAVGDVDDRRTRSGRVFDDVFAANRRGVVGYGATYRYSPGKEG